MPSPIGHGLAGLAIGLAFEPAPDAGAPRSGSRLSRFAIVGAVVGAAPDADLIYPSSHRILSHSFTATVLVMIVAALVTGKVTGRVNWRWVVLVGAAHASHVLLDWLGTDPYTPQGIAAFWPFSDQFYISGWNLFPPTERRIYLHRALLINVRAVIAEIAIMGPIAALAWLFTRRRRSRARTSVPDAPPRPFV